MVGAGAARFRRGIIEAPTNRITGILNGRREITGDIALRRVHFFRTRAEFRLDLQKLYELRLAREIARLEPPRRGGS